MAILHTFLSLIMNTQLSCWIQIVILVGEESQRSSWALYSRACGPMPMRLSHFTSHLSLKPRKSRILNGWSNLHGVLQGMLWSFMIYRILHASPPQRVGSYTQPGDHNTSKSHNPWFMLNCCVGVPTWRMVVNSIQLRACVVLYVFKACDHTKFNFNFNCSMVQPSDEFQGPLQVHGYGLCHTVQWPRLNVSALCDFVVKQLILYMNLI